MDVVSIVGAKWAKVIGGGIPLLLLALLLWVQNGRSTVQTAYDFYLSGDCQTALPLYERITRFPALIGRFLPPTTQQQTECQALLAAQQAETQGPETAVATYEQFVANFEDSPLTTPALAAIHRIYLDWAAAEMEKSAYRQALNILEKAAADYPALEAETEERLLQTYLAWGEAVESAGHTDAAVTIYNELQTRYPQFSAEAQTAIMELTENRENQLP